jgi:hypothetical protein
MANVLNRTTKEYRTSVNTPDFPTAQWIVNPDLSAVSASGLSSQYWNIVGDVVTPQSAAEQLVTDDNTFLSALALADGESELFGDGNDGDMVITVNTTLTRDIYPRQLTVNAGITLNAAGFRIVAKRGVTNNGVIHNNGSDAAGAVGGAAGAAGTMGGGTAGATGTNAAGVSSATLDLDATPGQGGRGGLGGNGSSGAGANGGQIRSQNNSRVRARRFEAISMMADVDMGVVGDVVRFHGGTGGGAGAGGGGANLGGGGGGGGGNLMIIAPLIFNGPGAFLQARGGAGGAASGGNAGGGGGGGGGVVATLTGNLRDRGSRDVTAGLGGAGAGTGTAGAAGNDGRTINIKIG